ncbi:phosphatase [Yinghuangia seranimata]|uniref:phosphatase n=1 Tax=Yinghuangia seranimata TaxID=408067 RepID=UPI00248D0D14|nr:phosphatase [Yinghuangia seranimata]MDI2132912.1 phosphatase [Yinghuangia seranimata]
MDVTAHGNNRAPDRTALRAHLLRGRIAGDVATPRENNLRHYRLMSERHPGYLFGLEPDGVWTPEQVLALMVKRCGVAADPDHLHGQDTIDPDLTLGALDAYADRLALAAERRERVFVGTGHPDGLGDYYRSLARALRDAGCTLPRPARGWRYHTPAAEGGKPRVVDYRGPVAVVTDEAGEPKHTHSARPIRAVLAELADAGEPLPDLVVGDHGWAGGAGQAGVDAIGFADCNDPALFVGAEEGRVLVAVPLDDNVQPHLYRPLLAYVLNRAGLS